MSFFSIINFLIVELIKLQIIFNNHLLTTNQMAGKYQKDAGRPIGNTLNPTMTGSTVMAITYDGGVAVASDRSIFYGKMERQRDSTRQYRVNPYCLVVFSGDFADFQWLQNLIERKQLDLQQGNRKQYLKPKMVHSILTTLFYQRRSKMNPIWNTIVVCGMQPVQFEANKFEPFIGVVNMYGVAYTPKYVATDFGAFILNQMLETRLKAKPDAKLTKEEAFNALEAAMKVSIYRSCKAGHSYDMTVIDSEGVKFGDVPKVVVGDWSVVEMNKNYVELF